MNYFDFLKYLGDEKNRERFSTGMKKLGTSENINPEDVFFDEDLAAYYFFENMVNNAIQYVKKVINFFIEAFKKIGELLSGIFDIFASLADCLYQVFGEPDKYKDKRRLAPPKNKAQCYNINNYCKPVKPIYNKRIKQFQYRKIAR